MRCCTTKGSVTGFSQVSLIKVKAHESFLFIEKFPFIENKEHLVNFVITLYYSITLLQCPSQQQSDCSENVKHFQKLYLFARTQTKQIKTPVLSLVSA